jgi:hypothetical protein
MASDKARAWRRSTHCDTNSCVEVAIADEGVFIRNSRESEGSVLTFTRAEWDAFVAGIKDGEF